MKDMTVKELIVKCGVGWNDFKAELLRRFEALEKELESWRGSRDGVLQHIDEMAYEIESLKCCGNCGGGYTASKDSYFCARYLKRTKASCYCSSWQSDGLTRAEREK